VHLILHENFYEPRASQMVASRTNAKLVVLPTSVAGEHGTGSYVALIDHIVAALTH
jgi:ABC-type Zn uptake system ZnuABC Zn-binding protein ZnuA